VIDAELKKLFPEDSVLQRWLELAPERVAFRRCPRGSAGSATATCEGGAGDERARAQRARQGARGDRAGSPRLGLGRLALPRRRRWPTAPTRSPTGRSWNALLNVAAGATWVSVHHGGGVGIGNSSMPAWSSSPTAAPMRTSASSALLTADPGTGVLRHADAGYADAVEHADLHGLELPMPPTVRDQLTTLRRGRAGRRRTTKEKACPARHG